MNRNLVSEIELGRFLQNVLEQEIQDLVYVLFSKEQYLKEQLAQKGRVERAALMNDETRKKLGWLNHGDLRQLKVEEWRNKNDSSKNRKRSNTE